MVGNVTMFPGKMHFFRPCWGDSTLEPNNTENYKKWREPPKMVILSGKHIGAKHHWEPNNSKNHEKWRETPKILILSGKHIGTKQQWKP